MEETLEALTHSCQTWNRTRWESASRWKATIEYVVGQICRGKLSQDGQPWRQEGTVQNGRSPRSQ